MAKKKTNATRAPDPVTQAAARASADLTELGARFALVDGLAVSAAKVATEEDWQTAEAMVRLIKERGFHRGRALVTRLRRWRRGT